MSIKKSDNEFLSYEKQKQVLVEYLKMKVYREDWHGVSDAAMDIREIEKEIEKGKNDGKHYLSE